MSGKIDVVVGGQFGSESKGRVTLDLIKEHDAHNAMVFSYRVAGPNAGHVVFDERGNRFALRQVPVGAVVPGVRLMIAAGSEVDIEVLKAEVELLESKGHNVRGWLYIHPEATVITQAHRDAETALVGAIGSTGKGIG